MGMVAEVRGSILQARRRCCGRALWAINLLKIRILSKYPRFMRDCWWEYCLRHQMHMLEARLAYACKHGFNMETANSILIRMLKGVPEFPSSIEFGEKCERASKINIRQMTSGRRSDGY